MTALTTFFLAATGAGVTAAATGAGEGTPCPAAKEAPGTEGTPCPAGDRVPFCATGGAP